MIGRRPAERNERKGNSEAIQADGSTGAISGAVLRRKGANVFGTSEAIQADGYTGAISGAISGRRTLRLGGRQLFIIHRLGSLQSIRFPTPVHTSTDIECYICDYIQPYETRTPHLAPCVEGCTYVHVVVHSPPYTHKAPKAARSPAIPLRTPHSCTHAHTVLHALL
jgi:hypothetical protein